jgi:AhpC/TSA family
MIRCAEANAARGSRIDKEAATAQGRVFVCVPREYALGSRSALVLQGTPVNRPAKRFIVGSILLSVAALGNAATPATRVGDFALLDQKGYFHQLSYYDNHKAVAMLVQANGSAATQKQLEAFKAAEARYHDQVKFFMINPLDTNQRAAVQQQVQAYGTEIPVLMDDARIVSEAMGVNKTGEVFLLNPGTTEVLYRGPAGKNLTRAIDAVLAGQPVKKAKAWMRGQPVTYPAKVAHSKSAVSYSKDIAPMLAENCARCHREGGIAPFAMNSYSIVKGFAPMIREVVMTKRMPPGQIDPEIGHFKETFTLTNDEQQKLMHWIAGGAEQDGNVDPLTQLTWPATKWAYGEPDLVIKVPPQQIPATGVLDYIRVVVPIEGLDRDRYVRASQYIAGDRTVLHHTLNQLIPPDFKEKGGRVDFGYQDPNAARITAYIPGAQPQLEPPNTGGLLKKGSSIALQLHYTTNGRATTDASEIGLWFYPDDQIPTERMVGDCACIFVKGWDPIPPYDNDHEMQQTITIPKDAYIFSMLPHMHFRGKRMRFYAEYPDGTKEQLLNIAKYNYNWQLDYELTEPKRVPAGTKIRAVAAFDNSTQNKANPDPARTVPWGQQSWDEMFFGAVTYKFVDQSGTRVSQN